MSQPWEDTSADREHDAIYSRSRPRALVVKLFSAAGDQPEAIAAAAAEVVRQAFAEGFQPDAMRFERVARTPVVTVVLQGRRR